MKSAFEIDEANTGNVNEEPEDHLRFVGLDQHEEMRRCLSTRGPDPTPIHKP